MLVTIFFGLPETLYVRSRTNLRTADKPLDDVHLSKKTYINRLALWSNHPELHLKANQFVLPAFKVSLWHHIWENEPTRIRWRGTPAYSFHVYTTRHSMDLQAFCLL